LVLVLILGCASSDGAAEVDGEVLLDGQPLAEGVIHFMPVDGKSRTESTFVRGGKFHARVPLGKRRVEISCVRPRALRKGQDADSAAGDEIVPARYNVKSELELEVKRGRNQPRFELHSN
jgi:hypothetical protein